MPLEPLLAPDGFAGLEDVAHLCTGGEAPWLKAHDAVYADFARLKSGGDAGPHQTGLALSRRRNGPEPLQVAANKRIDWHFACPCMALP